MYWLFIGLWFPTCVQVVTSGAQTYKYITRKKIPKLFYLHQKRAKYTTLILLIRSQILSLLFIIFSILLLTRKQWLDEALLTVKK